MNTNLTKLSLKLDPPAGKAPDGETPLVRALNLTEAVSSC